MNSLSLTRQRMQTLLAQLEDNWESWGAFAPKEHLYESGLKLVEELIQANTTAPWVVPTNKGGVQFEWAVGSKELEIEVVDTDCFEHFFEDENTGEVIEGKVTFQQLDILQNLLSELKPL